MTHILLYTAQQETFGVFHWFFFALLVAGLVALIFYQRRVGRQLMSELGQLDKIKKRNVEYEFVVKAMRVAIWHVDVSKRTVTYDNDFREKLAGYTPPPDTPLQELAAHWDEADRQRVMKAYEDICQGRIEELHEVYRTKTWFGTQTFWTECYATVAERDAEGNPLKVVGTSMRIDERKAMEDALVEARNRAQESDRLKSAFLANMSHEIRTPLNAIIGFTSVLPDVDAAEERKQLLDLIHENTQKLLRIIDDVVNISKVESGKEELVLTTFDLNTTLNEMADRYRNDLPSGVQLITAFPNSLTSQPSLLTPEFNITSDHNRICEVVKHYLLNAIKFTTTGTITLGYDTPRNGQLRIWVRDTGKGIAPEHQQQIFERFFKVDEFVPGAGLGLSICQTMAHSMGGKVGVDSQPNKGSTFWFELPLNNGQ